MKCYWCGYKRLTRTSVTYSKHTYQYGNPKPYFEMVPVCRDCAGKIGTGLFDGWTLVTNPLKKQEDEI